MKLLFVRHSIRGVSSEKLSDDSSYLTYLANDKNLSYEGQLKSYQFGEFIKENIGIPDFIYGDITDNRTIESSLNIAKSIDTPFVHFNKGSVDPFFKQKIEYTKESIDNSKILLENNKEYLNGVKFSIRSILPILTLSESTIFKKKSQCKGLLEDLNELYNHIVFTRISDINIISGVHNAENGIIFDKLNVELNLVKNIIDTINFPIKDIMNNGKELYEGILHFMKTNKFGVLVGHDTNIVMLSKYFGKDYEVSEYGLSYVPPNSGFLFIINCKHVKIRYVYLSLDGKWYIKNYLILDKPDNFDEINFKFDLIRRYTGV
jgi:hypothetical protein